MPNAILDQARARLSAIAAEKADLDREERELRAMIAAAEGATADPAPFVVPVIPHPAIPYPTILPPVPYGPPWPGVMQPHPPWELGPIWYVDPQPTITYGGS